MVLIFFFERIQSTRPILVYSAFALGFLFISSGLLVALGYRTRPKEIAFLPQSGSFNKKAAEQILIAIAQGAEVDLQAEIKVLEETETMWKAVREHARKLVESCRTSLKSNEELAGQGVIQKVLEELQVHLNKLEAIC